MASARIFSDAFVDEDPKKALEDLNEALKETSDNAEWLCQRAYAHILLKKYCRAVEDATKALELKSDFALAFMRKGIAEYHLNNFKQSHEAFLEGRKLDDSDKTFEIWIKRCEEKMDPENQNVTPDKPAAPTVKHDWYQTESQVIVTVMVKNVRQEDVQVNIDERELTATIKLPSGEDFNLKFHLLHPVIPQQSTFKVLSTKVEIKMKKTEAIRWEKLEGEGSQPNVKHFTPDQYPSSSHYTRNWDKLVGDIKEEEKNEKLEGDAALNKLFQQIYSDGSDDVKRAMNKSFMESGGTVLSTNWTDVGRRKVEMSPPDDVEWKKY
ncbi:protein SGT1 homolog isoform X1 [Scleropages formosus]|uniref:SGT1 homolog, MIS12 kinetochore complex assembly cochaperone n=1 Tax=Scleropages formosus TaxID=113540 RepID=A0A8C9RA10_SCLFO|nr:protein SGT1 homolog isoform X1 [Scleropages formosus]